MPSDAVVIRDAAFDLIEATGAFKTGRKLPTLQVQSDDLPAFGVYLLREAMNSDGDANAGEPRFFHDLTLAITFIGKAGNETLLSAEVDDPASFVLETLLTDVGFQSLFEGTPTITRQTSFPQNDSSFLAETRVEMTVQYRSRWLPVLKDDFNTLSITTRPYGHDTNTPGIEQVFDETT